MIILISGSSCTGKTLMAQTLLETYYIPYVSIDHLKMGLYRGNPDCGFTPLDSTEQIGSKLWPIVKGMIMTAIENRQHLILEGCYVLPRHVKELEETYAEHVIPVFLGFSERYIEDNFDSKIITHRNVVETRAYPEDRTVSQHISEHQRFRQQCAQYDVPYFEIDQHYESEIRKVYNYIEEQRRSLERRA